MKSLCQRKTEENFKSFGGLNQALFCSSTNSCFSLSTIAESILHALLPDMNMPIHKLLLPSSGQSPEWTTQPRPIQFRSPRRTCTAQPGRAIAALATRQVRRPAWFGGAKRWGRAASRAVLSRSGFAVRHVISSRDQPVAGEYEHMIEGSSPPRRSERFVKGMQCRQGINVRRSTARHGRQGALLVRAGDSHYTNRHKGLRRSKQGV